MAKTGKALHAALGPPAADNTNALDNIGAPTLSSAGLAIDAVAGAGVLPNTGAGSDPASVTLKAGASAGSLGGWSGTHYAHTNSTTEIMNAAVVYTNRGSPSVQSFTEKYGDTSEYTASSRTYNVGSSADAKIASSSFPTAGTKTFTGAQDLSGTYDGAPGQYMCAASAACTAKFTDNGIELSDPWTFVHASGARVSTPDAAYLYYGWWVSKAKDGTPTAASAFAGVVGDVDGESNTSAGSALTGSATYAGKAAGKFAMSNPLDGTGNGGHFTADAMLSAKFGSGSDAGMTGTINNFMLNDTESANWSVELKRGGWGDTGAINAPAGDDANKGTVWSINDNAAPASGTWSGTMYDEMPGNAPTGDGSNIPTTVIGTFYSEFSTIGRMVGGFGVNKQ